MISQSVSQIPSVTGVEFNGGPPSTHNGKQPANGELSVNGGVPVTDEPHVNGEQQPSVNGNAGAGIASELRRYPETGISVLVVGAGIGGLTAALECWRKGHSVRIFERAPGPVYTGKFFYSYLLSYRALLIIECQFRG